MSQLQGAIVMGWAVLAGCLPAYAEVTGEIVEWGITSGHRGPPPEAPGPDETGLAPAREMRGVTYPERTDTIEARLCRGFGIQVRLTRSDGGQLPTRVEARVAHPTFTRPDGATSTEDRFPSDVIRGVSHIGFTFDYEWEMVPGAWSIAVFVRGAEVARRDFTVVSPSPGAPRSECRPDTTS